MANQSSSIGFFLIAGFIVYITVRGELPAYLCVIGFGANCQALPQSTPVTTLQNSPPPSVTSTITNPGYTPISTPVNIGNFPPPVTTGINLPTIPTLPTLPVFSTDTSITFGGGADPGTVDQPPSNICYDGTGNSYNCYDGAPCNDNGYGDCE